MPHGSQIKPLGRSKARQDIMKTLMINKNGALALKVNDRRGIAPQILFCFDVFGVHALLFYGIKNAPTIMIAAQHRVKSGFEFEARRAHGIIHGVVGGFGLEIIGQNFISVIKTNLTFVFSHEAMQTGIMDSNQIVNAGVTDGNEIVHKNSKIKT